MLWLSRSLIQTRLSNSVKHEFDLKLEATKAENRCVEQALRADIEAKAAQIDSLRSGTMAAILNREIELSRRRIQAVDHLWEAVTRYSSATWISDMISVLKYDVASKRAAEDPSLRGIFAALGKIFDPSTLKAANPSLSRPYVSPMAWALFSAYAGIIGFAIARYEVLKSGVDCADLFETKPLEDVIRTAMPESAPVLEKFGVGAAHHLLGELERRIVEELRRVISGADSDNENLERAAKILREAERLAKPTDSKGA